MDPICHWEGRFLLRVPISWLSKAHQVALSSCFMRCEGLGPFDWTIGDRDTPLKVPHLRSGTHLGVDGPWAGMARDVLHLLLGYQLHPFWGRPQIKTLTWHQAHPHRALGALGPLPQG